MRTQHHPGLEQEDGQLVSSINIHNVLTLAPRYYLASPASAPGEQHVYQVFSVCSFFSSRLFSSPSSHPRWGPPPPPQPRPPPACLVSKRIASGQQPLWIQGKLFEFSQKMFGKEIGTLILHRLGLCDNNSSSLVKVFCTPGRRTTLHNMSHIIN